MNHDDFPAPTAGFVLTHFLVVADQDRSREFYRSLFDGQVLVERDPVIMKVANSWLILNVGGGPTDDKPTVTLTTPPDPNRTSAFLNVRVAEAMEILAPQMGSKLRILHQTGTKDVEEIAKRYEALESTGLVAQAVPFIDDMAAAYAGADLLVCRAGATTIAELTVCKKPAILVPFPFAADDHQTVNAKSMVANGAALLMPESELTGEKLAAELRALEGDRERLRRIAFVEALEVQHLSLRNFAQDCSNIFAIGRI